MPLSFIDPWDEKRMDLHKIDDYSRNDIDNMGSLLIFIIAIFKGASNGGTYLVENSNFGLIGIQINNCMERTAF